MNSVQSTFTFRSYAPFIILFFLIIALVCDVYWLLSDAELITQVCAFASLLLLLFSVAWIVFIELRTRMVKVTIDNSSVSVAGYGGLFSQRSYSLSEIDAYRISIIAAEEGSYEFMYLYKGGKKIIRLSDFYHLNYAELKKALQPKLSFGGNEKFSFVKEVKEMFD